MLTADKVLEKYFLDVRCMMLEIASTLDRFDRADGPDPSDPRLEKIYQSLAILADRDAASNRAERLLNLFSDPVEQRHGGRPPAR